MTKKVEFFFDYVSLYSYLANSQLAALDDLEVVYRPMLLGAVMQATGNRPPASVPAKMKYLTTDSNRWARQYGVPLVPNPIFPQNTLAVLRIATAALQRGDFAAVNQRIFDAAWVHKADLSDQQTVQALLVDAGLSVADYVDDIASEEIKAALKATTDEAVARGVFGAPTFFVGDEMFFGNDRMAMAAAAARA